MKAAEVLAEQQARGDALAETVTRYLDGQATRSELVVACQAWQTWRWDATRMSRP